MTEPITSKFIKPVVSDSEPIVYGGNTSVLTTRGYKELSSGVWFI